MGIPKAMFLTTAVVLAACSRNPQPGVDDLGRADTTMITDTTAIPVEPRSPDTNQVFPSPNARPDSVIQPRMPIRDSVHRDSVYTPGIKDSIHVPYKPDRIEGELIERNVPDSLVRPPTP
jgi:hypothetical protein